MVRRAQRELARGEPSGTYCVVPTLFVVMPIFNEPTTFRGSLARVQSVVLPVGWTLAPILVDDGSDSATASEIDAVVRAADPPLAFERHAVNRGKGAALQSGFARAIALARDPNDAVIIQDADLEYDPNDFVALLNALEPAPAKSAVFGNRWHGRSTRTGWKSRIHRRGNRLLTRASNLATGLVISDMECCYKLFSVRVLREILPALTENRFGIEPQIAAALARVGVRVVEAPVSYAPRSLRAGKKIGPRDGIRALWVIARSMFRS